MNIDLNETEIRQILEGVEPKTALNKLRGDLRMMLGLLANSTTKATVKSIARSLNLTT